MLSRCLPFSPSPCHSDGLIEDEEKCRSGSNNGGQKEVWADPNLKTGVKGLRQDPHIWR